MKATHKAISIIGVALGVVVVVGVNWQIIGTWFGKNGPADIGSIEVSYITMGRIVEQLWGKTWVPFWYLGFPEYIVYTPVLPALVALLHTVGSSWWQAYRLVTGLGYILAPVSVMLLGWQLSRRWIGGVVAAMAYSVLPTMAYFMDAGVRGDRFAADFLDPRRFTILVRWGEGPHTLALVLIPLVGWAILKWWESGQKRWAVATVAAWVGVGLVNAIGMFAASILVVCCVFAQCAISPEGLKYKLVRLAGLMLATAGCLAWWYNWTFVTVFFGEGGGTIKAIMGSFPWGWIGILGAVVGVYWGLRLVIRDVGFGVVVLWTTVMFGVVATYYWSASSNVANLRIELLPQALRYTTEMDLGFALLLGVLVGWLCRLGRMSEWVFGGMGVVLVIGMVWYVQPFVPVAARNAAKETDMTSTGEYTLAQLLAKTVNSKMGERVFVPGNYSFYLNYFNNVWQQRGAIFQASEHPWPDDIHYQMVNGLSEEIALDWLKIINARYLVVTTPRSTELYKEMKNVQRFESWPVKSELEGNVVYEVPLKKPQAAKVVNVELMQGLGKIDKADSIEELNAYTHWLEDSSASEATFEQVDSDHYTVTANVGRGEGIVVQMTADNGWHAKNVRTGRPVRIGHDGLDFMVLYPMTGHVEIELSHGRSLDVYIGYTITIFTILFCLYYLFVTKSHTSL